MTRTAAPTGRLFTGLSIEDLSAALGSRTRALAARRWLYTCVTAPSVLPSRIPNVAPEAWSHLRASAPLPEWRLLERRRAADGTTKYALEIGGASIETVLIPSERRSTVCVSSQAGCSRSCAFCATARLGFGRQLAAGEIVLQYLVAQSEAAGGALRNVVFMGMGEPMDNLEQVMAAVDRLLEPPLPRLAASHITVSTSGVLPGIKRFLREGRGNLALSLNATTDTAREALMPHRRQWPIGDLLEALREDQRRRSGRRYFIEYVLWQGVNDSDDDARRLVALLDGLEAHVNLIPHNPFAGSPLRPSTPGTVARFQALVHGAGVRCLVRPSRGQEIAAACGQLALSQGRTVLQVSAAQAEAPRHGTCWRRRRIQIQSHSATPIESSVSGETLAAPPRSSVGGRATGRDGNGNPTGCPRSASRRSPPAESPTKGSRGRAGSCRRWAG